MDFVSLLIVGVVLAFVFRRLKEIASRLDGKIQTPSEIALSDAIRNLEARINQLESQVQTRGHETVPPVESTPATDAAPSIAPVETIAPPSVIETPRDSAVAATARAATGPLSAPVSTDRPARPAIAEQVGRALFGFVREQVGSHEWESIVGGNLLNKVGVLVLLIGVTLFLGFSLTRLGAAGKIAVGLAVSLAMLTGGILAERRSRYVVFGRGLIGGGWAGIYTTAFAAHGLPTARVIESPTLATILLLAVAAAMIAHSIRYRSEAVTALAYLIGFVTLAISPMSSFALFASIPLVASLLYIANRFHWERIAVAGIVVTYASYAWATREGASSAPVFATDQAALAIYWLIYEGFDLAALYREGRRRGPGQILAALNASGFVGVSMLQWLERRPDDLFVVLAYSAAAFVISAIVRARIVRLSADSPLHERAAAGSYELSITISAALAAAAIFQRYAGYSINVALLLEAQFLFLIGVQTGQSYLQILGAIVFAIPVGKLGYALFDDNTMIVYRGLKFSITTPIAILTAAAGYLDRAMAMRAHTPRRWRILAWTASIILGAVIANEAEASHTGIAWLALGGLLFEAGWLADDFDFRLQSYVASSFGLMSIATVNLDFVPVEQSHRWVTLALAC
ncbi:MAG: DUF2339 domain-containing protein [Candidatus Binatus sp.]|uniref:DUF2339 domain-containing protein n=1 Tax=Candidatus Binatus sp. TaxID=2811406 RepID=UPI00272543AC|nr:DUF2339 domain-containing protein [Candidatus Binatus sp.]MDO8434892.1 DUF2339 domain-containing protein [Candidatus Binatus sp.]